MNGRHGPCPRSRKRHSIGWNAAIRIRDADALPADKARHFNPCLHPPFPKNPKEASWLCAPCCRQRRVFHPPCEARGRLLPPLPAFHSDFSPAPESGRAGFSPVGGAAPSQTPKAARTFARAAFSFSQVRPSPGVKTREQGKYGDGKGARRKADSPRAISSFS